MNQICNGSEEKKAPHLLLDVDPDLLRDLSARHHLLAADRRQGRRQRLRREDALARLLHGRRALRASRLLLLADLARSRICKTAARTTNLHKISQEWTLATSSHSLNPLR